VFAGISGVLVALVAAVAPSAQGSTSRGDGVVCSSGFRGERAYDLVCLGTGTQADAALAWYLGYSDEQRRADCRSAQRMGGMLTVVKETRGDVLFDNFRNDGQMVRWTAEAAVANCVAWGYEGASARL